MRWGEHKEQCGQINEYRPHTDWQWCDGLSTVHIG